MSSLLALFSMYPEPSPTRVTYSDEEVRGIVRAMAEEDDCFTAATASREIIIMNQVE